MNNWNLNKDLDFFFPHEQATAVTGEEIELIIAVHSLLFLQLDISPVTVHKDLLQDCDKDWHFTQE